MKNNELVKKLVVSVICIILFIGIGVALAMKIINDQAVEKKNRPEPKTLTIGKVYCIGNFEFVATGHLWWSSHDNDWNHRLITSIGEEEYYQEGVIKECLTYP